MPRNSQLILLRNANIKKRYELISDKNKKWRHDAVLEQLKEEFFLETRTLTAILNDEAAYRKIETEQLKLFAQ